MIRARLSKCLCGGDLIPVVLNVHEKALRNGETFIFEKVPVEKCLACGDMFYRDVVIGMFEDEIKKRFPDYFREPFDYEKFDEEFAKEDD